MKRFIKTALVLLSVTLPTIYACSQPPVPPVGPQLAGPAGPGRTPPPPPGGPDGPDRPGARPIQQLITVQGTLNAYTASDSNAFDGLTLQNGGQSLNIRFAPHMAAQIMAVAKTGTAISVQGFYETTPEGMNVIRLVNATSGSQTIYDGPPPAPANPPAETIQPFNGAITDLHRDRQGMPNGIVLSGDRVIELPPGVYDQLQAYLKPSIPISGSGFRLTPPPGVVLAQSTQIIHPQTLTLNGQTYMVR
jgi:hypothetical protein